MNTKNKKSIDKYMYTTSLEWIEALDGTHLQGYVGADRRTLEQVFGEPHEFVQDDGMWDGKVTTEWIIQFADGAVATVYDWKRYGQGSPALDEFITWHIGGHRESGVVERIKDLLPPF